MTQMPHWPIPSWKARKYDLETIGLLLKALYNPHLKLPPTIHIAGTNGKGSTLAFMRSIFEQAGLKVHVYTSPHLVDFNERIVLASEKIDDQYLFDVIERTRLAALAQNIECSFFEGITAAAFLAFSEVKADVLLLETGMGGRLDATNAIPRPLLTIITTISYDHMDYLGSTLPIIAKQKAGIIKPGTPCVISCQVAEVYQVLFNRCQEMRAPITAFGYDFGVEKIVAPATVIPAKAGIQESKALQAQNKRSVDPSDDSLRLDPRLRGDDSSGGADDGFFKVLGIGLDDLALPEPSLPGDHQLMNAATALAGVSLIRKQFNISDEHIIQGLQKAKWAGRCQQITEKLWVDGAHNIGGAQVLSLFCKDLGKPISLILGLTKNRNPVDFLNYFKDVADHVFCLQVRSEASSYSSSRLAELAAPAGIPLTACDCLEDALELAAKKDGVTVVTGSLFLAADLFKLKGLVV